MEERNVVVIMEKLDKSLAILDNIQKMMSGQKELMDAAGPNAIEYKAVCSQCKRECMVPFKPRDNWPVYCRDCYAMRRR